MIFMVCIALAAIMFFIITNNIEVIPIVEVFKTEVIDKEHMIGYDNIDWKSITIGWAIAKSMHPTAAHEFSNKVRDGDVRCDG